MQQFDEQVAQLRNKWPQAHIEPSTQKFGLPLCIIPGMELKPGWFIRENGKEVAATICTVLFEVASYPSHVGPLDGFMVDLPDMRLAGGHHPKYARPFCDGVSRDPVWYEPEPGVKMDIKERLAGHEQWRCLTRFWWRQQLYDPNHQTLFTCAMLARQRLRNMQ